MAYVLTIGGSVKVMQPGWSITAVANGLDQFTFRVRSLDGSYRPTLDQEVVLTEGGVRIFGGNITAAPEAGLGGHGVVPIETTVTAMSFNALADRRLYSTTLIGPTLKAALQDLVPYIPGATLDPAQVDGPTLPDVVYADVRVRAVLDDLTILSGGYLWEGNANNVWRMYLPGTAAAPFAVTAANGLSHGDVVVEPTMEGYANVVIVRTATEHRVAFDTGAIATYGYWEAVYVAPDTTTEDACGAMATMILARSLVRRKTVRYFTYGLGLKPGQTQTITFAARNVNNTFLITGVKTFDRGPLLIDHEVTAIEGTAYQTGWQDKWRQMTGSTTRAAAIGGGGGGGPSVNRPLYFLGGSAVELVQSPTATWVPANAIEIHIDTVARGSTTATVTARLRAVEAGVSVRARLYDVSASAPCPGLSAVVTSTAWTTVSFVVTLTPGDHIYRADVLPSVANSDVGFVGFLE